MTYNIKNLNVASLDFDDIKTSMVAFLQQQEELKNLDFQNQASAVNMLLNILCTATAYNGVYAQYGFINSFATTATVMESLLGIASNNSVLVIPTKSASCNRTVTVTSALDEYSAFRGTATNGADLFFYNIESIPANTSKSINLYSGLEVVFYTNYDFTTQSCELPYSVNPDTIGFYETDVATNITTKWTRVDKANTTTTKNNTHFSVINGPQGYVVTNNFASSKQITTSSKVIVKAIISNGSVGNNGTIGAPSNVIFGTSATPNGGYNEISMKTAKASLLFKATGQERCVTLRDYKNAIMSSGISGTENESSISVGNDILPGQVKIYVDGLGFAEQSQLIDYISNRVPVGISVVYKQ